MNNELKNCNHCFAAEDTANLWRLKCTTDRHRFVPRWPELLEQLRKDRPTLNS